MDVASIDKSVYGKYGMNSGNSARQSAGVPADAGHASITVCPLNRLTTGNHYIYSVLSMCTHVVGTGLKYAT